MNKYAQFKKHDAALHGDFLSIEREQMQAARLHKPGYRRKMRRKNTKRVNAIRRQEDCL